LPEQPVGWRCSCGQRNPLPIARCRACRIWRNLKQ
jgi:hypothetical protein